MHKARVINWYALAFVVLLAIATAAILSADVFGIFDSAPPREPVGESGLPSPQVAVVAAVLSVFIGSVMAIVKRTGGDGS
jgi:hypothetical protein